MRTATSALLLLAAAGCDDDDWHWHADPELVVHNTGVYPVRVEVEDVDDDVFTVDPGERVRHGLSSWRFEVKIRRTADGLLLLDADFDADDFDDDDQVEIVVTP